MAPANIVEVIRRETVGVRERTALADGAIEITYGGLLDAVDAAGAALQARGVRPLDRVAFLCEDCADYVVWSLAILRIGAVVVPVSPSLMGDELESVLDRMDVHALVFDAAAQAREGAVALPETGCGRGAFALWRRAARGDLPADYAGLNPAFIRFSSGTTGTSKGVLLSHETIVARTDAADRGLAVTSADTVIWVLSMSFHFVVSILLYLRRGASILICRQPFPQSFLEASQRRRGTLLYAAPFHLHLLATSPLVAPESLAGLRLAISTAMKLDRGISEAFERKFGFVPIEAYGIIELGLPFIGAAREKVGGVGRALPGFEVRIDRPDAGGVGAIRVRGPGMFDAYVSPWRLRDEALEGGWFDTGDLGRLDADGRLFILGREKQVINFVGTKIFPYEVEEVLAAHPAVRESLVYGEPHPAFGQLPCAKVVPADPAAPPDPADLRDFCRDRLALHKVPKVFAIADRLERTESGKIKRG